MKTRLLKILVMFLLIISLFAFASCTGGSGSNRTESESYSGSITDSSSDVEPWQRSYVKDGEIFYFERGERIDIDKAFATVSGKKYYAVNNMIFFNINIIDGRVYDFGDDGALTDRTFDNEFVGVDGKTYYAVNNEIVIDVTIIVGMKVYNFGKDGALIDKVYNEEIVEVDGKKYYVVNNEIIINITVIISDRVYRFGDDGALTDKVYDKEFVSVGDKEYYVENNRVIFNRIIILDGKVYEIGNDGTFTGKVFNGEIVKIDGKEYYVANNKIIIDRIIIIENHVYYFGNDGVKTNRVYDCEILEISGKKYYVENNLIRANKTIIYDRKVLYFGNDGVLTDRMFEDGLIEINTKIGENKYRKDIYYIINNTVIVNLDIVINGELYRFGGDGAKTDEIVNGFFGIGEDTYYIVKNKITVGYMIYEEHVYNFADDGKMRRNAEYDGYMFNDDGILVNYDVTINITIIVNGTTYSVIDDKAYPARDYNGKVTINGTDKGIEDALCTIEFKDRSFAVTTDENGRFKFVGIPNDGSINIQIKVSKSGYIKIVYDVKDEDEDIDLSMDITFSEGLEYNLKASDNSYKVVGMGVCTDENIKIPENYEGLPVTEIGERAFFGSNILSVVIPETVTFIGEKAFSECENLIDVTISDVTKIGKDVFRGSIKVIIIPIHKTVYVEAKPATCYEAGNIAYYYCALCDKYYEDNEGKIQLYNVTIAPSHSFVDGICEKCGAVEDGLLIVRVDKVAHLGKFALGTLEDAIGLPSQIYVYTKDGCSHLLPIIWDVSGYDKSKAGTYTIRGVVQAMAFHFADGVNEYVETELEITELMKGTADIVFVLDISGSMSDEIAMVKNNIIKFAQLIETKGVSARWSVITYSDFTCSNAANEKSTIIKNGASNWFITADTYRNAISGISLADGGDWEETAVDGLLLANTGLDTRKDARTFYVLLTDAVYKNNNNYGYAGMSDTVKKLVKDGINVSTITSTDLYGTYRNLTDSTGGVLMDINSNFAQALFDKLVPIIYADVMS